MILKTLKFQRFYFGIKVDLSVVVQLTKWTLLQIEGYYWRFDDQTVNFRISSTKIWDLCYTIMDYTQNKKKEENL